MGRCQLQSASPSWLPWQQEDRGGAAARTFWKVGRSSFFAGAKFHMLSLSQEAHVTAQPGDRGWGRGMGKNLALLGIGLGGIILSSSLASALKALQRHAPPDGPGGCLRVVTWDGHLDPPRCAGGLSQKQKPGRPDMEQGPPALPRPLCTSPPLREGESCCGLDGGKWQGCLKLRPQAHSQQPH